MEDDKCGAESCHNDREDDVISIHCSDDDLDSDNDESPRNKFSLERAIKQEKIDNYPRFSVVTTLLLPVPPPHLPHPPHLSSPPPVPPTTQRPSVAAPADLTRGPTGQNSGVNPVESIDRTATTSTSCRGSEANQSSGKLGIRTGDGKEGDTGLGNKGTSRVGQEGVPRVGTERGTSRGTEGATRGGKEGAATTSSPQIPPKDDGRVQDDRRGDSRRLPRRPVVGRSSFTPGRRSLSEVWKRKRGRVQVSFGEKTMTKRMQDADARRLWERMQLLQEQNAELKNLVGTLYAKVDERVSYEQRLYQMHSGQNCRQGVYHAGQPRLEESPPELQAAPGRHNYHQGTYSEGQQHLGESPPELQVAQGNHNCQQVVYRGGQPRLGEVRPELQGARTIPGCHEGLYDERRSHLEKPPLEAPITNPLHYQQLTHARSDNRRVLDQHPERRLQDVHRPDLNRGLGVPGRTLAQHHERRLQEVHRPDLNRGLGVPGHTLAQHRERRLQDIHRSDLNRGLVVSGHTQSVSDFVHGGPIGHTRRVPGQVHGAAVLQGSSLLGDPPERLVVQGGRFSHPLTQSAPVGGVNRGWVREGRGILRGIQRQHAAHVGAPIAERVMNEFGRHRRPVLHSRAVPLQTTAAPELHRGLRYDQRVNSQVERNDVQLQTTAAPELHRGLRYDQRVNSQVERNDVQLQTTAAPELHRGLRYDQRVNSQVERNDVQLQTTAAPELHGGLRYDERVNSQVERNVHGFHGDQRQYILCPMEEADSVHSGTGDQRRFLLRSRQQGNVVQAEERFHPSERGECDLFLEGVDHSADTREGYPGDCYGWEEGEQWPGYREEYEPSRLVRQRVVGPTRVVRGARERLAGHVTYESAQRQESLYYRDIRGVVRQREVNSSDTRNVRVGDVHGYQQW